MSVERNLAISLLKLTKEGQVLIEAVKKDARLPLSVAQELLLKLQNEGLVYLKPDSVEVDSASRLKLALKAAASGGDFEYISHLLCWQEFEEIAALALKNNGYTVQNNARFKSAGKRWEIDVVACKKPLVICIDCKHWQHSITPSALKCIVDLQEQRTKALAESLPNLNLKLECSSWDKAKFLPAVLALFPSTSKFVDQVPIVPVLQLQDFIYQLPIYLNTLRFYPQIFQKL